MNPLISIIIPVYNTDQYLHKCLESVADQSYKNIEILLINDGSTDNSGSICEDFTKKDPRFKHINKENEGPSKARNLGIQLSTGLYINFIDSDDYIAPSFVEKLYNACITYDTKISMCGRFTVTSNELKETFTHKVPVKWSTFEALKRLLSWNQIDGAMWDKLFHRDVLHEIRFKDDRIAEDIPVLVNIICQNDSIVHIGEPLYYYIQRENSRSHALFSMSKLSMLLSANEVKETINKKYPELKNNARFFYDRHLIHIAELLIENGHGKEFLNVRKDIRRQLSSELVFIVTNRHIKIKSKLSTLCFQLYIPKMYTFILFLYDKLKFSSK